LAAWLGEALHFISGAVDGVLFASGLAAVLATSVAAVLATSVAAVQGSGAHEQPVNTPLS
jgi:hypothetical protein